MEKNDFSNEQRHNGLGTFVLFCCLLICCSGCNSALVSNTSNNGLLRKLCETENGTKSNTIEDNSSSEFIHKADCPINRSTLSLMTQIQGRKVRCFVTSREHVPELHRIYLNDAKTGVPSGLPSNALDIHNLDVNRTFFTLTQPSLNMVKTETVLPTDTALVFGINDSTNLIFCVSTFEIEEMMLSDMVLLSTNSLSGIWTETDGNILLSIDNMSPNNCFIHWGKGPGLTKLYLSGTNRSGIEWSQESLVYQTVFIGNPRTLLPGNASRLSPQSDSSSLVIKVPLEKDQIGLSNITLQVTTSIMEDLLHNHTSEVTISFEHDSKLTGNSVCPLQFRQKVYKRWENKLEQVE